MFVLILIVNLILCQANTENEEGSSEESDFGEKLVSSMRNDANLDLPVDEEYEDLRAELLAYHTALASISSSPNTRRSLLTTPCWQLGGICVEYKLCRGFRFLTEVPGCKNRFNVCCFTWNKYKVSDFRDEGIANLEMPWGTQQEFGGLGIKAISPEITSAERKKQRKKQRKLKLNSTDLLEPRTLDFTKPSEATESEETKNTGSEERPAIVLVLRSNK